MEGISFSVDSLIGENATFWTFNDQLITDGEFESRHSEQTVRPIIQYTVE